MKRWIGVLLGLALTMSTAMAEAESVQAMTEQTAHQLMEGNFVAIEAQLDDTMRTAVDEQTLASGWAMMTEQLGVCTGLTAVQADETARAGAAVLAHERGTSLLSVAYDAQGRISSLFLAPRAEQPLALERSLPAGAQALPVTLFAGTDHEMTGEVIVPAGADADTPYIVMAQGSGPSDMDETIGGNKPFRDLAYDLAALGVGSIRHDKITYAHPTRPCETVDQEYLEPVREALDVLRAQTDAQRVYLLGHSEGGMITPYLVQACGFDGGICVAGTPLTLWEIALMQNRAVLQALEGPQRGAMMAQLEAEEAKGRRLPEMSDEEAAGETVLGISAVYLRHMARMDQAQMAKDCGKPFLFLWGERDFQVERTAFEAWQERLGDDPRFTYRTYPGLNHLMMPAGEKDSILNAQAAYLEPKAVDAQVAADIAAWMMAQ